VRPILPGARGPAVEDIQRRLLRLGYQLGPTGVDGVFLGRTRDAVISFQSTLGLSEDGVVGDETWAALVDETFTLGDRMLYLRLPHFHGKDVGHAQEALNALGFACGDLDGIFGGYTERAVREFQRNSGLSVDGILGTTTVHALMALRHVWEGKDATIPTGALTGPVRSAETLSRLRIAVGASGEVADAIADRVVNLAQASAPGCMIRRVSMQEPLNDALTVRIVAPDDARSSVPVVSVGSDALSAFSARLLSGIEADSPEGLDLDIAGWDASGDPEAAQRLAVRILDALCAALA